MAGQHALYTGPSITGRIPDGKGGYIDVTGDYAFFDTLEEAQAAADAVEVEHLHRHTHPLDTECDLLGPVADAIEAGDETRAAELLGYTADNPAPDLQTMIVVHREAHAGAKKKAGL